MALLEQICTEACFLPGILYSYEKYKLKLLSKVWLPPNVKREKKITFNDFMAIPQDDTPQLYHIHIVYVFL